MALHDIFSVSKTNSNLNSNLNLKCNNLELNTIYETNSWLNQQIYNICGIQLKENNNHFEIQYAAKLKTTLFKNKYTLIISLFQQNENINENINENMFYYFTKITYENYIYKEFGKETELMIHFPSNMSYILINNDKRDGNNFMFGSLNGNKTNQQKVLMVYINDILLDTNSDNHLISHLDNHLLKKSSFYNELLYQNKLDTSIMALLGNNGTDYDNDNGTDYDNGTYYLYSKTKQEEIKNKELLLYDKEMVLKDENNRFRKNGYEKQIFDKTVCQWILSTIEKKRGDDNCKKIEITNNYFPEIYNYIQFCLNKIILPKIVDCYHLPTNGTISIQNILLLKDEINDADCNRFIKVFILLDENENEIPFFIHNKRYNMYQGDMLFFTKGYDGGKDNDNDNDSDSDNNKCQDKVKKLVFLLDVC